MSSLDLAILNHLESEELAPLNWGLVDSGFDEDELLDLIDNIADDVGDGRSAEDIRDSLARQALITRVLLPMGPVWRTRMAESVRLLVRMRQLFPPDRSSQSNPGSVASGASSESWRTAPTLVSDYRFVARPRRFPERSLSREQYCEIALDGQNDPDTATALSALTDPMGGAVSFSAFQARSARSVLRNADSREPSATLITAGTGAGKTKAFYLPALAKLSTLKDGSSWTKLVAVYPRTELLKDQLSKALGELRVLHRLTGIRLTLGTMYGDTPWFADGATYWKERDGKRICPFLSCPACGSDMHWFLHSGVGALTCALCPEQVLEDELLLSRRQQQETPPDVLLTTTETLNRQLSNDYTRHVFGAGQSPGHRPRLLLLDEVHTFVGPSGAHAALLLRRWRQAVGQPVHTVGLSATVVDGGPFLGDLAGVPQGNVTVIEPAPDELVDEGKEYLIALRGDPASGTALLSTTIQASMLLRRVLDRADRPVSNGAFGSKLFLFTDDLDVTNRLLHFLRNAEGQKDRGTPDTRWHPDGSLANLRHPSRPNHAARLVDGQSWDLSRAIGHDLSVAQSLRIERTSSQDPGLERASDIVVATSSLEVGLDDDSVGAVLQHKAPRDNAAFLQRRGRAGRPTAMRPWTAVVLSDYGRDRSAFQAWDALFDPTLQATRLPIRNRHVLRIQASFALLDWIAEQLRNGGAQPGYIWYEVRGPDPRYEGRRRRVRHELVRLLEEEGARRELATFLRASLGVSTHEVERLLWEPPRAVLTSLVPTLLRRIDAKWVRSAPGGGREDLQADEPLPDFLPSALFADLLLPEVEIMNSESAAGTAQQYLGVQQALREFAPGRVTHRYAVGHTLDRQWIGIQDGDVSIQGIIEGDPLLDMRCSDEIVRRVIRPWRIRPTNPPTEVKDSSNARPVWESTFEEVGEETVRTPPSLGRWTSVVPAISFRLHESGGHLVVNRAAIGSEATVRIGSDVQHVVTHFVDDDGPVALGFRLDVDSVRFDVKDPMDWRSTYESDPTRARTLRTDWFREFVRRHPSMPAEATPFLRNWLAEMALALVAEQGAAGGSLNAGTVALQSPELLGHLNRILTVVFQSVDPVAVNASDSADEELSVTRLHKEIMELASSPGALLALSEAARELHDPTWSKLEPWLRDRFLATVAGAVGNAAGLLHEEISLEELIVDRTSWKNGQASLIFTERRPGGVGILETFFDRYHEDPRRFWRLVEAVVGTTEGEQTSSSLSQIVRLAAGVPKVGERLTEVRNATSLRSRKQAWRRLVRTLDDEGVPLPPSVRIAMSTRLLRPGSTTRTDVMVHDLLARWSATEELLGIELDPRVFAHLVSDDPSLDETLAIRHGSGNQDRQWRFNAIISVLWPRGGVLRSQYLEMWQPFHELPVPERTLLLERIVSSEHVIPLRDILTDAATFNDELATKGVVGLSGGSRDGQLKTALLQALMTPIEFGVLELFPRVVGISRSDRGLVVRLEVPEVFG